MNTLELSNGRLMPCMVVSTNWMDYLMMKNVVKAALKCGFRAFDTARDYGNENIVGKVIKECLVEQGLTRKDVFITTKIGNSQQELGNISEQIDISLSNLQTDYVDLWMMHWPFPEKFVETWKKMESIYKTGKVKSIGMANFHVRHFEYLFSQGIEIIPHSVQFELHPMRTAEDIVVFCRNHNIAIQAYSPLCRMIEPIRKSNVLNDLALKYNKSVGQIILRWHIQNFTAPVFKSTKSDRIFENSDIFDFVLSDDDIQRISAMDEDYKFHLESASCPGF